MQNSEAQEVPLPLNKPKHETPSKPPPKPPVLVKIQSKTKHLSRKENGDLVLGAPSSLTIGTRNLAVIKTGITFEIPNEYRVTISPSISIMSKSLLFQSMLVSPSVSDEIVLFVCNYGEKDVTINEGDELAIIYPYRFTKNLVNVTFA